MADVSVHFWLGASGNGTGGAPKPKRRKHSLLVVHHASGNNAIVALAASRGNKWKRRRGIRQYKWEQRHLPVRIRQAGEKAGAGVAPLPLEVATFVVASKLIIECAANRHQLAASSLGEIINIVAVSAR